MLSKPKITPDDFWQEFEEKTGEKVLARCLGKYLSGWEEFDLKGLSNLWGLIIATSGGFRFHHFPQQSWFDFLSRQGGAAPKEKTFFIPKEKIISSRQTRETRWWKKLLSSPPSHLFITYLDEEGNEKQLITEIDLIGNNNSAVEFSAYIDSAATAAPKSDACSTGAME